MIHWLAFALLSFPGLQNQSKAEQIFFKTEDGITIYGLLQKTGDPEGKPSVICIPMYNHPKEDYRQMIATFAMSGITALAIDPRGQGNSVLGPNKEDLFKRVREKDPKLFNEMYKDVHAAADYLTKTVKTDPQKIGLLGASVGCSVAIHAASQSPGRYAAVACLAPGENYLGVPTMEHLKAFGDTPLFLVAAQDEENKGTTQIFAAMKGRPKTEKKVMPVTGAHGTNLFNKDSNIFPLLTTWFSKQFSGATAPTDKKN